jgi:hypothetical protein
MEAGGLLRDEEFSYFSIMISQPCQNLSPFFAPVFVKDMEIKLPAPPKKAKKAGKGKGGKKR